MKYLQQEGIRESFTKAKKTQRKSFTAVEQPEQKLYNNKGPIVKVLQLREIQRKSFTTEKGSVEKTEEKCQSNGGTRGKINREACEKTLEK